MKMTEENNGGGGAVGNGTEITELPQKKVGSTPTTSPEEERKTWTQIKKELIAGYLKFEMIYGHERTIQYMCITEGMKEKDLLEVIFSSECIEQKMKKDAAFLDSNDPSDLMVIIKTIILGANSKDRNKMAGVIQQLAEMMKEKGTGTKFVLTEVGDKKDKKLKKYKMTEE